MKAESLNLKCFSPAHQAFLEDLFGKIIDYYGPRLTSLVLYGSYARKENRLNSDVDLLIVLNNESKRSRLKLNEEFVKEVEFPLDSQRNLLEKEGILLNISSLILTEAMAKHFLPLYLDMVEYHRILFDKDSFMQTKLEDVRRKMARWGSQKREIGGHWYWEIRPGLRWGEIIDYDQ